MELCRNPERIEKFFLDGMKRNCKYDNLVTIGMRGDGDTAMGNGDDAENIKTLRGVVTAANDESLVAYGRPANAVPHFGLSLLRCSEKNQKARSVTYC